MNKSDYYCQNLQVNKIGLHFALQYQKLQQNVPDISPFQLFLKDTKQFRKK